MSFSSLKGWNNEQAVAVRPALLKSCQRLNPSVLKKGSQWGSYDTWQSLCKELALTPDRQLQTFFEQSFQPIRVGVEETGLFTGYYSPVFHGSLTKTAEYSVPLLALPKDLVRVKLSDFGMSGHLAGRMVNGHLKPYGSRAEISRQVPDEKNVLLWMNNPVDAFFLHIQGSGNVELTDGRIVHVGYAGSNGYRYVAIGKVLKDQGELTEVSMQSIKAWLQANPDRQQWLFNQNPRYIFFRFSEKGAVTSQGVTATAERTLAVDPSYIPLGIPLWLDTSLTATGQPFRRMMVAQDTGSAIKGEVRGDIYMGVGDDAAHLAGEQQAPGKLYVLVPREND